MTKLINLDELNISTERVLTWKGVQHPVKDLVVGEYIAFQKAFALFSKAYADDSVEGLIEGTRRLLAITAPTFPSEDVGLMNPAQLLTAVSLVANLISTDPEASEGQGDEGKAA